jgi:hypothetical protein
MRIDDPQRETLNHFPCFLSGVVIRNPEIKYIKHDMFELHFMLTVEDFACKRFVAIYHESGLGIFFRRFYADPELCLETMFKYDDFPPQLRKRFTAKLKTIKFNPSSMDFL